MDFLRFCGGQQNFEVCIMKRVQRKMVPNWLLINKRSLCIIECTISTFCSKFLLLHEKMLWSLSKYFTWQVGQISINWRVFKWLRIIICKFDFIGSLRCLVGIVFYPFSFPLSSWEKRLSSIIWNVIWCICINSWNCFCSWM